MQSTTCCSNCGEPVEADGFDYDDDGRAVCRQCVELRSLQDANRPSPDADDEKIWALTLQFVIVAAIATGLYAVVSFGAKKNPGGQFPGFYGLLAAPFLWLTYLLLPIQALRVLLALIAKYRSPRS